MKYQTAIRVERSIYTGKTEVSKAPEILSRKEARKQRQMLSRVYKQFRFTRSHVVDIRPIKNDQAKPKATR